jgi:ketosteroid isomerase-like protein
LAGDESPREWATVIAEDSAAAVVERVLALVGSLDIDGAARLLADDLVLELPFRADGGSRRLEGVDASRFIRSMPKLFERLPFDTVTIHGQLPSGMVVAEYTTDGVTHAGRSYRNSYVGFFRVRAGKVIFWREYFDPNVISAAFPEPRQDQPAR